MQTAQSKTLPASQVQNNFGAIVKQVRKGRYKEVIVQNRGESIAAIVGMEELEAMREFRKQEKRKKALACLREAREEVQARLKNKLTYTEAMKLADRFSHEIVEDMAREGKVKFERKSS
ncbi:type II toxin-antitoxin system Phd/YefM family antitoxin [Patescibacteria group bacterium]|nr:type II toxin-antitoxin system Phd/YefM family antitoxin [Patescibacteria group bacterium]